MTPFSDLWKQREGALQSLHSPDNADRLNTSRCLLFVRVISEIHSLVVAMEEQIVRNNFPVFNVEEGECALEEEMEFYFKEITKIINTISLLANSSIQGKVNRDCYTFNLGNDVNLESFRNVDFYWTPLLLSNVSSRIGIPLGADESLIWQTIANFYGGDTECESPERLLEFKQQHLDDIVKIVSSWVAQQRKLDNGRCIFRFHNWDGHVTDMSCFSLGFEFWYTKDGLAMRNFLTITNPDNEKEITVYGDSCMMADLGIHCIDDIWQGIVLG